MSDDWGSALKEIGDKTDKELESRISSLTRMKDEEIAELFPDKGDKKKLVELMQIVEEASIDNRKTARLVDNIQELAGTAVKLLARFV